MAAHPATTILIADDEVGHRKVLELVLSAHNYEVLVAEDGHEALTFLQARTPDALVLDVHMPHMTGIEVCRRLRRVARLRDVPVIVLTSATDPAVKAEALAAGVDLVLEKPITGKDIPGEIARLITARLSSTSA